jgi:cytochrome c-type biogenesis protein CcmH/NrfG
MDDNSPPRFSQAFILNVTLGVVVLILLVYIIAGKLNNSQKNEPVAQTPTDQEQQEKSVRETVERIEKETAANPTVENYFRLGFVYFNTKRYQDCITVNRKALELNPNTADAYNNMCCAYNEMQKYDSAVMAGTMALQLKPDFALAKNNLEWAKSKVKAGR